MEETSNSSAAAGVLPEDMFRSASAVDSIGDSSTAQLLHFSSGNPRIEEIRGVMHLFRNDVASSSKKLPVERKPLICVLGVPNHMTYADFCQFCGSFIEHIMEMRIVRTDGLDDRYSVLIRLDNQESADSFYKHHNGKHFSSLEEETCRMFFTVYIQYTGSIEHSQPSAASSIEQPSCAVCLERLDQDTAGILTTICNHSFHCSCISNWGDSSCPVCRYCQQQPEKSTCYICQTSENLWMCIMCGFVGCGRYREGHAISHWEETEHCYSIELETQRVWDYAGDNYVHRLIQSKTDGKLVELNHHCLHNSDGYSDCMENSDTLDNQVEYVIFEFFCHLPCFEVYLIPLPFCCCSFMFIIFLLQIKNEYNELLISQLESQKNYYESKLQQFEEDAERESSTAVKKALSQNPKLLKLQAKLDKYIEEKKFLDEINDNLSRNQGIWESQIMEIEKSEKKLMRVKDKKIEELEEQLRSMMASLETQSAEQHQSTPNELKDSNSNSVVAESSSSKSGNGTKSASQRRNKK